MRTSLLHAHRRAVERLGGLYIAEGDFLEALAACRGGRGLRTIPDAVHRGRLWTLVHMPRARSLVWLCTPADYAGIVTILPGRWRPAALDALWAKGEQSVISESDKALAASVGLTEGERRQLDALVDLDPRLSRPALYANARAIASAILGDALEVAANDRLEAEKRADRVEARLAHVRRVLGGFNAAVEEALR